MLVNIGNGHTVCLLALEGRVAGVFEHHTALPRPRRARAAAAPLAGRRPATATRSATTTGTARCWRRDAAGAAVDAGGVWRLPLIVTGPRRDLLAGSELPAEFAAPHGDMMLTGCFGLLRAIQDRHEELA